MKDTKNDILDFWFVQTKPAQWFQKNPDFDALIRDRFGADYDLGAAGIYDAWMDSAEGCLALIILLDQFPRNMFRDSARSFSTDEKALFVARHAVQKHFDKTVPADRRRFVYLPFEHSENAADQDQSVTLFSTLKKADPMGYDYAVRHRDIIVRFGRFPHRNAILNRPSTPAEKTYLAEPGSGF